jgi:hypothetical protein
MGSKRHDKCPKYLARSTFWKHLIVPTGVMVGEPAAGVMVGEPAGMAGGCGGCGECAPGTGVGADGGTADDDDVMPSV